MTFSTMSLSVVDSCLHCVVNLGVDFIWHTRRRAARGMSSFGSFPHCRGNSGEVGVTKAVLDLSPMLGKAFLVHH